MSYAKKIEDYCAAVVKPEEKRLCEDDIRKLIETAASILEVPPSQLSDELYRAIELIDDFHKKKRTKPIDLAEETFSGAVLYIMSLLTLGKNIQQL